MSTTELSVACAQAPAWNKCRIVGQRRPLQPKHVWTVRVRLEIADNVRDLALVNMVSTAGFAGVISCG
jgi:hypothetical protein